MEAPVRGLRPAHLAVAVVVIVGAIVLGDLVGGPARLAPRRTPAPAVSATPAAVQQSALGGPVTVENRALGNCVPGATALADCGPAPALRAMDRWFHTPGGRAVRINRLRGHVVLVDFFSSACGICQRDQVYLSGWRRQYADAGLRVIGVLAPHWDFERRPSNARAALRGRDVPYPVGLDTDRRTYHAYRNAGWPGKYLIDGSGRVRAIAFGTNGYAQVETQLRMLLAEASPGRVLPPRAFRTRDRDDLQASEIGFGYAEQPGSYVLQPWTLIHDRPANYPGAREVPPSRAALSGRWNVGAHSIAAVRRARLVVGIAARRAWLVVAGRGRIVVRERGRPPRAIRVRGEPGSVTLFGGHLDFGAPVVLDVTPGVRIYAVDME